MSHVYRGQNKIIDIVEEQKSLYLFINLLNALNKNLYINVIFIIIYLSNKSIDASLSRYQV